MLKLNDDLNIFALAARIKRPLILDGAMGSLLQQKGVPTDSSLWMSLANLTHPDIVQKIHSDYIKAGADIITTNTFRTNPAAVKESGSSNSSEKLVKSAIDLARSAADGLPVIIAGSNAPAEDCYRPERSLSRRELELNHKRHINSLFENGAHFILNETQSHFDEINIISEYCDRNEIPYVMNIFFGKDFKILSGEKLPEVLNYLNDTASLAVGFNCILDSTMSGTKRKIKMPGNWGLYLNCGDGTFTDTNIKCGVSPKNYADSMGKYLGGSPSFIGACCGSSPAHIRAIKRLIDGIKS